MDKKMKSIKSTEDGILSKLFRNILFETGLIKRLDYFITRYIRANKKGKNRATVTKAIIDGEMTWKVFMFLIFEILRVKKMKIKITLEHVNDTTSEHEVTITPSKKILEEGEDDGEDEPSSRSKK